MTARWQLQIDRIVVIGASGRPPAAGELRTLAERAVTDAVAKGPWPVGSAARASVQVNAPSLNDAPAIAQAVGRGVSLALKGRSHG
jgi:hypothetical protein